METSNQLNSGYIGSFRLELPENNWKYFNKFCNPFAVVIKNCVIPCISM